MDFSKVPVFEEDGDHLMERSHLGGFVPGNRAESRDVGPITTHSAWRREEPSRPQGFNEERAGYVERGRFERGDRYGDARFGESRYGDRSHGDRDPRYEPYDRPGPSRWFREEPAHDQGHRHRGHDSHDLFPAATAASAQHPGRDFSLFHQGNAEGRGGRRLSVVGDYSSPPMGGRSLHGEVRRSIPPTTPPEPRQKEDNGSVMRSRLNSEEAPGIVPDIQTAPVDVGMDQAQIIALQKESMTAMLERAKRRKEEEERREREETERRRQAKLRELEEKLSREKAEHQPGQAAAIDKDVDLGPAIPPEPPATEPGAAVLQSPRRDAVGSRHSQPPAVVPPRFAASASQQHRLAQQKQRHPAHATAGRWPVSANETAGSAVPRSSAVTESADIAALKTPTSEDAFAAQVHRPRESHKRQLWVPPPAPAGKPSVERTSKSQDAISLGPEPLPLKEGSASLSKQQPRRQRGQQQWQRPQPDQHDVSSAVVKGEQSPSRPLPFPDSSTQLENLMQNIKRQMELSANLRVENEKEKESQSTPPAGDLSRGYEKTQVTSQVSIDNSNVHAEIGGPLGNRYGKGKRQLKERPAPGPIAGPMRNNRRTAKGPDANEELIAVQEKILGMKQDLLGDRSKMLGNDVDGRLSRSSPGPFSISLPDSVSEAIRAKDIRLSFLAEGWSEAASMDLSPLTYSIKQAEDSEPPINVDIGAKGAGTRTLYPSAGGDLAPRLALEPIWQNIPAGNANLQTSFPNSLSALEDEMHDSPLDELGRQLRQEDAVPANLNSFGSAPIVFDASPPVVYDTMGNRVTLVPFHPSSLPPGASLQPWNLGPEVAKPASPAGSPNPSLNSSTSRIRDTASSLDVVKHPRTSPHGAIAPLPPIGTPLQKGGHSVPSNRRNPQSAKGFAETSAWNAMGSSGQIVLGLQRGEETPSNVFGLQGLGKDGFATGLGLPSAALAATAAPSSLAAAPAESDRGGAADASNSLFSASVANLPSSDAPLPETVGKRRLRSKGNGKLNDELAAPSVPGLKTSGHGSSNRPPRPPRKPKPAVGSSGTSAAVDSATISDANLSSQTSAEARGGPEKVGNNAEERSGRGARARKELGRGARSFRPAEPGQSAQPTVAPQSAEQPVITSTESTGARQWKPPRKRGGAAFSRPVGDSAVVAGSEDASKVSAVGDAGQHGGRGRGNRGRGSFRGRGRGERAKRPESVANEGLGAVPGN